MNKFENEEISIKLKELCLKKLVDELKTICQEIGCSGVDPDMCQNRPHHCNIIKDYCSPME